MGEGGERKWTRSKPADHTAPRAAKSQTHKHTTHLNEERPASQSHFKRFACSLSQIVISENKKAQSEKKKYFDRVTKFLSRGKVHRATRE
jgi:hypothetical protein